MQVECSDVRLRHSSGRARTGVEANDPEPTFDARDPGRTVGEEFGPDGSRDVGERPSVEEWKIRSQIAPRDRLTGHVERVRTAVIEER
jgi:hypothetical protein